jgi:hypothetical protein
MIHLWLATMPLSLPGAWTVYQSLIVLAILIMTRQISIESQGLLRIPSKVLLRMLTCPCPKRGALFEYVPIQSVGSFQCTCILIINFAKNISYVSRVSPFCLHHFFRTSQQPKSFCCSDSARTPRFPCVSAISECHTILRVYPSETVRAHLTRTSYHRELERA